MTVAVAFPFVDVQIDTKGLQPIAQRSPGVLAIVGVGGGAATNYTPVPIYTLDDATQFCAGGVTESPLYRSIRIALLQSPRPSLIYGVQIEVAATDDDYKAGLAALDAADDVTFVCLAEKPVVAVVGQATPNVAVGYLRDHCEANSAAGQKRIGVAHISTAITKATALADVIGFTNSAKSTTSRMVMIAARGADNGDPNNKPDVAAASASAIAGLPVAASAVLKPVVGFQLPIAQQYTPSEIIGLSQAMIIPIIDPALIPGESLHFAEGSCFTTNADLRYIDTVRLLDDIDFRLRAGLIGLVGDSTITRAGLNAVVNRAEAVLEGYINAGITDYSVIIPVLEILRLPESARSPGETLLVQTSRQTRTVAVTVVITMGPAIHTLNITLLPTY